MSDSIQQIQGYEVLDDDKPAVFKNNGEVLPGQKYFYTDWESALGHCKEYLNVWSDYLPEDWQPDWPILMPSGSKIEIRFLPGIEW